MARPFDSCNYVAPEGFNYVAVVDCQKHYFANKPDAERAYNVLTGEPNEPVATVPVSHTSPCKPGDPPPVIGDYYDCIDGRWQRVPPPSGPGGGHSSPPAAGGGGPGGGAPPSPSPPGSPPATTLPQLDPNLKLALLVGAGLLLGRELI